jgi:hypothetical protein
MQWRWLPKPLSCCKRCHLFWILDPTTGELSRISPKVKFLVNDTTKYDMEILEGLTDFSSGSIVTFLEDIEGEKPYVSINNFSVHHWHPN